MTANCDSEQGFSCSRLIERLVLYFPLTEQGGAIEEAFPKGKCDPYWKVAGENDDVESVSKQSEDPYEDIKGGWWQFWGGGAMLSLCEQRSRLLFIALLGQYLLFSVRLYVDVFVVLTDTLTAAFRESDPSGTLATIATTSILLVGFGLFGLLAIPCFVLNNVKASLEASLLSYLYYLICAIGTNWYFNAVSIASLGGSAVTSLSPSMIFFISVNALYTFFAFVLGTVLLWYVFNRPNKSYYVNRLEACRVYARHRVKFAMHYGNAAMKSRLESERLGLGFAMSTFAQGARHVGALDENESKRRFSFLRTLTKSGSDDQQQSAQDDKKHHSSQEIGRAESVVLQHKAGSLDKSKWDSLDDIGSQLKAAWLPTTKILQSADVVYEVPPLVVSSIIFGCCLLVLIAFNVQEIANSAFEWTESQAEIFDGALEQLDNTSIPLAAPDSITQKTESITEFLQGRYDFYKELSLPLYQSILGGAWLGILWTLSFIPSALTGFKRAALELRLGIATNPGMKSRRRESIIKPYRVVYLFGAYLSCIGFAWVLSSLLFFLVVLLFAWPPFGELVWYLNFLYLPSIFIAFINMFLNKCIYEKNFHQAHKGEDTETFSLTKPHKWSVFELGMVAGYFPAGLLAALMRCIYILCVALLGVLRVDTSLLPPGTHSFDTPYTAFAALCIRGNTTNSPLVIVAADMLRSPLRRQVAENTTGDGKSFENLRKGPTLSFLRARNRFQVALLLLRFPHLVSSRKHNLPGYIAKEPTVLDTALDETKICQSSEPSTASSPVNSDDEADTIGNIGIRDDNQVRVVST